MHSQTFGVWAWKQNSTKKHPMIPLFRILPGILAVGMLTGKAVGHHMSTLMPAVTPHLTASGCLLFGSCFCFAPSCGGTKTSAVPTFYKGIELLIMIWTLVFCLIKKTLLGFYLACFLWAWGERDHWQHRGQRLHPCIWPYFITAYFGKAQSPFFLLLWLFLIAGRKCLLSVRKFLYYLPLLKKYHRYHWGMFQIVWQKPWQYMTYSAQWQTALLFWWGNCIFPLSSSWQSALSLGKTNKFLYCG